MQQTTRKVGVNYEDYAMECINIPVLVIMQQYKHTL